MQLSDLIEDDYTDPFITGYEVAKSSLNLENCEAQIDEALKLFRGDYLNLLDDSIHELSSTTRMQARVQLELIAERHGMKLEEFTDLVKYNSEGVFGAIVNAIVAFFKSIIDFITSLFKSGTDNSGPNKSTKEIGAEKVKVEEVIKEANEIIEYVDSSPQFNNDETQDTVPENDDSEEMRLVSEFKKLTDEIKRRNSEIKEIVSRTTTHLGFLAGCWYMETKYKVDLFKELYIDYEYEIKKFNFMLTPDSVKFNIDMPKYSNTDVWKTLIKENASNVDISEYPENEIVCAGVSVRDGDINSNVFIDLIVFSSDCGKIKKITKVRVTLDPLSSILHGANDIEKRHMLLNNLAIYCYVHEDDFKHLPKYRALAKDMKKLQKQFKSLPKEKMQELLKEQYKEKDCGEVTGNYFEMITRLLSYLKGIALQNGRYKTGVTRVNKVADKVVELNQVVMKAVELKKKID